MKTYKTKIQEYTLIKEQSDIYKAKISSSRCAADYARQFYHDDLGIYESFFLMMLNQANNTIGYVKISQGGIAGTVVDPRLVAHFAVKSLATAIILVHNHPSGNLQPSHSDKTLTVKIKKGLEFLDIKVLDHVILTEDSYHSFADEGLL